jgi:hypothetical protein
MDFRRIPSAVLAIALVLCACEPGVAPLSEEDVASINEAVRSFQEAALAGDFAAAVES